MQQFLELYSLGIAPTLSLIFAVLALILAGYSAWLSNPGKVTEHYTTSKRWFIKFIKKVTPFACATSLVAIFLVMPEPITKLWFMAAVVSLLALCFSLAITWVNHIKSKIDLGLDLHEQQLKLFQDMLNIVCHSTNTQSNAFQASIMLHKSVFETFSIMFPDLQTKEGRSKIVADHLRRVGDEIVDFTKKIQELEKERSSIPAVPIQFSIAAGE